MRWEAYIARYPVAPRVLFSNQNLEATEVCHMAEERKYRIRVDGILVDVSKEVYHAYYSIERHTRTLDEKDTRNGKVLYSDLGHR